MATAKNEHSSPDQVPWQVELARLQAECLDLKKRIGELEEERGAMQRSIDAMKAERDVYMMNAYGLALDRMSYGRAGAYLHQGICKAVRTSPGTLLTPSSS